MKLRDVLAWCNPQTAHEHGTHCGRPNTGRSQVNKHLSMPMSVRAYLADNHTRVDQFVDSFQIDKNGVRTSKLEMKVVPRDEGGKWIQVEGHLNDYATAQNMPDEYRAGGFRWMVDLKKHDAYLDVIHLDKQQQGKGLATELIKKNIDMFQKNGVNKLDLLANGDVGGYAWSVFGFDFASKETHDEYIGAFKQYIKRRFAHDHMQMTPEIQAGLDSIQHTWDIARFRVNDEKLGKKFMLKHHWDGSMDLHKNSDSMKVFNAYAVTH